jgi:hypothetical protein
MTMTDHGDPTGQVFVQPDDEAPTSAPEADQAERRGALRTATVISGRIVLGLITVGALAILVAASILLPLPSVRSHPISTVVAPVPTVQQLVCPGKRCDDTVVARRAADHHGCGTGCRDCEGVCGF